VSEGPLGRVLLKLPSWLGDLVMAAPTVAAIHRARPGATLVAEAPAPYLSLAARLPGVAETTIAEGARGTRALAAARRRLRALRLDAAVVFPRGVRAALGAFLARVPVRVGFDGRGPLLTHPVPGWRPLRTAHRSAWYGLLAGAFGASPGPPERLVAPPEAVEDARRLLGSLGRRGDRPLVLLEPAASYGPAKCWPAERYGDLAARLLEAGAEVLTVGTEASRDVERRVAERAGPGLLRGAGKTPDVLSLLAVLSEASLLVSNDTGPMHLAAAAGTPVLALFGATDPVATGPLGPGPRRIVWDPEPCSPCLLRTCPVPGHPCLEKIGVERVLAEALSML
jgi:heptosyltransferase-2